MKIAALTEKEFQTQVLQLARLSGCRCYHTHDSRRSAPGFPNLVLVRAPVVVFAELKTETGYLRPEQRGWPDTLEGCESVEAHLWRPSDWLEIEQTLARRSREGPRPPLPGRAAAGYVDQQKECRRNAT